MTCPRRRPRPLDHFAIGSEYNMQSISRLHKNRRFSRVVTHGGVAYFSGLTADDWDGNIEAQTEQTLAKADALLSELKVDRSSLLSATIWLRNMADFGGMNSVWERWIDPENPPARATVESTMASPDVRIEIQFVAAIG